MDAKKPSRTIKGVLFDKDGTLLDFDATWPSAFQTVAEDLAALAGDPALAERIMRRGGYDENGVLGPDSVFACGSTADIAALCADLPELAKEKDLAGRIDAQLIRLCRSGPMIIKGLPGILESLRGKGLKLGMATNDGESSARAWLAFHGLGRFFAFVSGADSGFGAKPHPRVIEVFCERTGLESREVAVVGDAVVDGELARAGKAGLSVMVRSGVAGGDHLARVADVVIDSIADLESVLGS